MPLNNESPSMHNRVPIAVTSRDFTSATRCLSTNAMQFSAYGQSVTYLYRDVAGISPAQIERRALTQLRRLAQEEIARHRTAVEQDAVSRAAARMSQTIDHEVMRGMTDGPTAAPTQAVRLADIIRRPVDFRPRLDAAPAAPEMTPDSEALFRQERAWGDMATLSRNDRVDASVYVTTNPITGGTSGPPYPWQNIPRADVEPSTATALRVAQEEMSELARARLEDWFSQPILRPHALHSGAGAQTYKKPEDPEAVARALGVVEDQTLAALRKLKQLGWVWDGKDWVYDYKGNIVGISET